MKTRKGEGWDEWERCDGMGWKGGRVRFAVRGSIGMEEECAVGLRMEEGETRQKNRQEKVRLEGKGRE